MWYLGAWESPSEEKSMAMDTVSKYKVGLWQDGQFFLILTAVLCDGNSVSR